MKNLVFKERLLAVMEKKNITQKELGRLAGIDQRQISKYCNGITEPRMEKLQNIAKVLDINEAYLLGANIPAEKESETHLEMRSNIISSLIYDNDEQLSKIIAYMKDIHAYKEEKFNE